jgi:hypothetical protein
VPVKTSASCSITRLHESSSSQRDLDAALRRETSEHPVALQRGEILAKLDRRGSTVL